MLDKAVAQRHLTILAEQLSTIDAARKGLLDQLASLDAQSTELQRKYNRIHNDSSLIAVLPDEILSAIFLTAHAMLQHNQPPIEIQMSQITHHWRNVALDTPQLWSRIEHLKFTSLYLRRSKAVPFTLDLPATSTPFAIGDESEDKLARDAFEQLPLHLSRCTSLKYHCKFQREILLLMRYLESAKAPRLLTLDLNCQTSQRSSAYKPVLQDGLHIMRKLHLHNIHLKAFQGSLASVTTITFTATRDLSHAEFSAMCDALTSAPSLSTFRFMGDVLHGWEYNVPILAPSLRRLYMKSVSGAAVCGILSALSAPSLSYLYLGDLPAHAAHGFPRGPSPGAAPRYPALRTIEIGSIKFDRSIIIEAFPTIEELVLGQFTEEVELLLALFHNPGHWPQLRMVTIQSRVSPGPLEGILLAREAMGCPIKKLRIYPDLLRNLRKAAKAEGSVFGRVELAPLVRSM
ncbi:hypothetical protein HWV62_16202 [Athelia sp. TMB]|nr:hypothetical protein HWV62_16202 [Athelia sp. TMB]